MVNLEMFFPYTARLSPPQDFFAFVVWISVAVGLVFVNSRIWQPIKFNKRYGLLIYSILAMLAVVFTFIGGFELANIDSVPVPNLNEEAYSPKLLVLFMVPFQLAAGFFGIGSAVIIALISGVCLSFFETHSIFTLLEITALATLFSLFVQNDYREPFFKISRIPIFAAAFSSLVLFPFSIIFQMLSVNAIWAVRIDFALTQSWQIVSVRSLEMVIAGAVATIPYFLRSGQWYKPYKLVPSPIERNIGRKAFFYAAPIFLIVISVLTVNVWNVAGRAAEKMLEKNMRSSAEITADSLPYFLEAGQNLLLTMADPALLTSNDLQVDLTYRIRSVPFFRQLYVFDEIGRPMDGYPERDVNQLKLNNEEYNAIDLALKGVTLQTYTSPPLQNEDSAQVSFIVGIKDELGETIGVLVGKTDLNTNPFTQPAIEALNTIKEDGGQGIILDENDRILFHTTGSTDLLLSDYQASLPVEASMMKTTGPSGSSEYVYYQPMIGKPWSVLIKYPAHHAQTLSLETARPLFLLLLALTVIIGLIMKFIIDSLTKSVKDLSRQAALISQGNLDSEMPVTRVDELGELAYSFEKMRLGLRERIAELKDLLNASQGVASHLDIEDAILPLLHSALPEEAYLARIVLDQSVFVEDVKTEFLSIGIGADDYELEVLDKQLFDMGKKQTTMIPIPNFARYKRLSTPKTLTPPGALLALPLNYEREYFGVIWVAYDKPTNFTESYVQFLSTLAGQAALAAANAKLFNTAELGRERFESVLNSTPEPVMVFDEYNRLFLINPAAKMLEGLVKSSSIGLRPNDIIENQDLFGLLTEENKNRDTSREIKLENDRVYYTTVSPVASRGQYIGKVCILRDITHFKELDTLKSDIVDTVSHDLRQPLSLMSGYTTMLQMVGSLNDQQKNYVSKIVTSVEGMKKMVNDLLELGRVESDIGLKLSQVDIGSIIEHVLTDQQAVATQKKLKVNFKSMMNPGEKVEVDEAMMKVAVGNLLQNAIKYTPLDGKIDIRVRDNRNGLFTIEVQDNGIGVSPIDLPHLFEKFYRSGHRDAHKERGTGLGLAIVKSIVERHNGKAWAESKLGRGSVFYLRLPKKQS